MSEQAHDMSKYWRIFTYQHGRVNGTFIVSGGKEGVHHVKPLELTLYVDDAHSWGRIIQHGDLTAFVRDEAIDIPKHMIREGVRPEIEDAWGEIIAAITACVVAFTRPTPALADSEPSPDQQQCPECVQGKHGNCIGWTLDADDNQVACATSRPTNPDQQTPTLVDHAAADEYFAEKTPEAAAVRDGEGTLYLLGENEDGIFYVGIPMGDGENETDDAVDENTGWLDPTRRKKGQFGPLFPVTVLDTGRMAMYVNGGKSLAQIAAEDEETTDD